MDDQLIAKVFEKLGALEAKADAVLAAVTTQKIDHAALDDRVQNLEAYRAKFLGIIAAVSILATLAWQGILAWWHPPTTPTS